MINPRKEFHVMQLFFFFFFEFVSVQASGIGILLIS